MNEAALIDQIDFVRLRESTLDDVAFIVNTLLVILRKKFPFKHMGAKRFNWRLTNALKKTIAKSNILIACDKEDSTHIYGFIMWEEPTTPDDLRILHTVYVKSKFRGIGIGTLLLKTALPRFGTDLMFVSTLPDMPAQDEDNNLNSWIIKNQLIYDPFHLYAEYPAELITPELNEEIYE